MKSTICSGVQESTETPLLWPDAELEALLSGSPVLPETRGRVTELKRQWQALDDEHFSKDRSTFTPGGLSIFFFHLLRPLKIEVMIYPCLNPLPLP